MPDEDEELPVEIIHSSVSDEKGEDFQADLKEFGKVKEKLDKALQGKFVVNENDFHQARAVLDRILAATEKYDYHVIERAIMEKQLDVELLDVVNYSELYLKATAYLSYFIEQEENVNAHLSWYNTAIKILSSYATLLSKEKSQDKRESEATVRIRAYYLQKQRILDLYTRVKGKRISCEKKCDGISRTLSFWDVLSNLNPGRAVGRPQ